MIEAAERAFYEYADRIITAASMSFEKMFLH